MGLDVYEFEPHLTPGLTGLRNVVLMPHVGSGTKWTREAMAVIAAKNVAGILRGLPVWGGDSMVPFLSDDSPTAAPSIINARELGLKVLR